MVSWKGFESIVYKLYYKMPNGLVLFLVGAWYSSRKWDDFKIESQEGTANNFTLLYFLKLYFRFNTAIDCVL